MLTESTRRHDFPTLSGITYLNTAAESIPPRCTGEAIEAYCKALCLDVNYVEGWYNLGCIYAKLGRTNEASYAFSQAVRRKPD